jgi:hypothetical protein
VSVPLTSGVPQDITVERDGGRYSTLVPIGLSNAGTVVSVECNCTPKTYDGFSFHEFSFDVLRFSGSDVFSIQNRLVARKILPDGGVHLVLSIVLASYSKLIQALRPDYIYRVSAFTGLQEAPLRKHLYITESVQLAGYNVSEKGRDSAGRSFWLHERVTGRSATLFDFPEHPGKLDLAAIDGRKSRIAAYFSDSVHGEMKLLGTEAAARHKDRVKMQLRKYAQDAELRESTARLHNVAA